MATDQRRQVRTRVFECFLRRATLPMGVGGMSVKLAQKRQHGIANAARDGCAGVVVEIDRAHLSI